MHRQAEKAPSRRLARAAAASSRQALQQAMHQPAAQEPVGAGTRRAASAPAGRRIAGRDGASGRGGVGSGVGRLAQPFRLRDFERGAAATPACRRCAAPRLRRARGASPCRDQPSHAPRNRIPPASPRPQDRSRPARTNCPAARAALASPSRRHKAGPRRGSARHRAAGDIPRRAARPPPASASVVGRRAAVPPAPQRQARPSLQRTLRQLASGHCSVSGRKTIGACRPLAPCTVMIRTSSRPRWSRSRLTSDSPAASQARKPCSDGPCIRS